MARTNPEPWPGVESQLCKLMIAIVSTSSHKRVNDLTSYRNRGVSMMKALLLTGVVAVGIFTGSPAKAVTINFDDGTSGTVVGTKYSPMGVTFSGATFTSNLGENGASGSLGIFSTTNGFTFGADTPIAGAFSFTASSISIRGLDVGAAGIRLEAFNASNTLVGFDQFFGTGLGTNVFHDLTVSGSNITSFRFYQPLSNAGNNSTGDGVLFDNLNFTVAVASVPEPASLALLGLGVAGVVAARRRRAA